LQNRRQLCTLERNDCGIVNAHNEAHTAEPAVAKIGVLGGTFDPVHMAHLAIAERAREQFGLARVLFVPAWMAPHKPADGGTACRADHRMAMLRLAIEGNPAFEIDPCELARGGTSYTIDTLLHLRGRLGAATELVLLIGADNYLIFRSWRAADDILRLCTVAVYDRPGSPVTTIEKGFVRIDGPAFGLASSWIRSRMAAGASIRYLVPDRVAQYIAAHRLYNSS